MHLRVPLMVSDGLFQDDNTAPLIEASHVVACPLHPQSGPLPTRLPQMLWCCSSQSATIRYGILRTACSTSCDGGLLTRYQC